MTKAEIIAYLKRKLGAPTVNVELTDDQFGDAVDDALRLFNRYLMIQEPEASLRTAGVSELEHISVGQQTNFGSLSFFPLRSTTVRFTDETQVVTDDGAGNLTGDVDAAYTLNTVNYATGAYDFRFAAAPPAVATITATYQYSSDEGYSGTVVIDWPADATGVLYCAALRPRSYQAALSLSVFEIMFRMLPTRLSVGEWYEARSLYETFQKVRGTYPAWLVDQENRKLYVDCSAGPYNISIVWAKDMALAVLFTGSKKRWSQGFLDLSLAYAKQTLSNVRGKFGNVAVPGGSLTTDAEKMSNHARADIDKIEEKLRKAARLYLRPRFA